MRSIWINCLHMVFGAVVGVLSLLYVLNYRLALTYQGTPQFFEIKLESIELSQPIDKHFEVTLDTGR